MPGGHAEQLDALAAAYEHVEHVAQPAALGVPPFTTAPANPGAQMLQAATDALAMVAVQIPVGHTVQLAAPPAEYAPAAHKEQAVAPTVAAKEPEAHGEQAEVPAPAAKVPGAQRAQLEPPEAENEPGAHGEHEGAAPPTHDHEPSALLRASVALPKAPCVAHAKEYEDVPPVGTAGEAVELGKAARKAASGGCARATTSAAASARE